MQPMAVDLQALRALLTPGIRISPGRAVMARVVATGTDGRGSLSIAGLLVEAQLPEAVRAGQELRLLITDVSAERVLLTISEQDAQGGGQHQAAAAMAVDPGAQAAAQAAAHAATAQSAAQSAAAQLLAPPVPLPGGGTVAVTERDARRGGRHAGSHAVAVRYDAPSLGAVDLRFVLSPESLALNVTVDATTLGPAQSAAGELREALAEALGRAVSVSVTQRRPPVDVYA